MPGGAQAPEITGHHGRPLGDYLNPDGTLALPPEGIQGNLDPVLLLAPKSLLAQRSREILDRAGGRPGHIFNLGHGILPPTPEDAVKVLIETVHGYST